MSQVFKVEIYTDEWSDAILESELLTAIVNGRYEDATLTGVMVTPHGENVPVELDIDYNLGDE